MVICLYRILYSVPYSKSLYRYQREHQRKITVKRELYERLREIASIENCSIPQLIEGFIQCYDEISTGDIGYYIADGLLKYIKSSWGELKVDKPFGYPGGDWYIKDEILRILARAKCSTLVEVFGGSGVISMYAPRNIFKIIVYNDKLSLLTNFFTVLKERSNELARKLILTPFSRELCNKYRELIKTGEINLIQDPIEKATIFYFLTMTTFSGKITHGFKIEKSRESGSRPKIYMRKIAWLTEIAKKWLDVTIENRDYKDIIPLYDSKETVFYCDPPYIQTKETHREHYLLNFTHEDMQTLLNILAKIKGKFTLKLPEDHLEIKYIKQWINENKYQTKTIEHWKYITKNIDEEREKQKTILIYNY